MSSYYSIVFCSFLVEFFHIHFLGIQTTPGHTMPVTINSGNKEDDIQHSPPFF